MTQDSNKPFCFGDLETVFPKQDNGLRVSPESCIICCRYKTECLRTAMKGKDGMIIQEENVDKSYEAGMLSFWERWSRKKYIKQKLSKKQT